MSRRVRLDFPSVTPGGDIHLPRRLGRHLWARLHEYEGLGLTLSGPGYEEQEGVVWADFPSRDNAEMTQLLSRRFGVQVRLLPEGLVCFCVGPDTSFEDIDYVQGAIGVLLS